MKSVLLFAITLTISFSSLAQQPDCYKAWNAKEIKGGDSFKVYLIYLKRSWDQNGANVHMHYSQVFEVTGTLKDGSYSTGNDALKFSNFAGYMGSPAFRDAVFAVSGFKEGGPDVGGPSHKNVIVSNDLGCVNDMLEYWKKKNTADYGNPSNLNSNLYFDFDFSFELDQVDGVFKALKIQEKQL